MANTVLYIDGENLKHYLKTVLLDKDVKHRINLENFNLKKLFELSLKGIKISEKRYYSARLRQHPEYLQTLTKSKNLILKQRIQKTVLEKLGFTFIISGNVRPYIIKNNSKTKVIFKEKGVDVRIAVDLITDACDKKVATALLCSSDSDLQPAVREARKRGLEIIYIGFEIKPNKGLSFTTNRTILIRNSEVIEAYRQTIQSDKIK